MYVKTMKTAKVIIVVALVLSLVAPMAMVTPASASDPFIAEIIMFGGNFAPRGWAFCEGQLLAISSNTALCSLLGTTYGGDGRTTLALPDLRGRVAVHPGTGPGLSTIRLGERGGSNNATLTIANMPSHNHIATTSTTVDVEATLKGTNDRGNQVSPANNTLANDRREKQYRNSAPNVDMNADSIAATATATSSTTIANTGGSQAFNIMQPYLGINYIIALVGVFPSRN